MKEMQVCREAVSAGSEIVAGYFRDGVEMRSKEPYNLVSDADVDAEKRIVEVIRSTYPDHSFLGEEVHAAADTDVEHLWVIDPVDGTNNFAHRVPHFAVSLAYYHEGVPMCGVVTNPVRDDCYEAVRGQGAFHNGQRVRVGEETGLDQVLIGVGFYYDRGKIMEATLAAIGELFGCNIHGIRRMGTASLDLCQVGMGMYGLFFEYQLQPWDFGAGRLFVEEAGGRVTTCKDGELPLKKTSLLASNGLLHDAALAIVGRHLPSECA